MRLMRLIVACLVGSVVGRSISISPHCAYPVSSAGSSDHPTFLGRSSARLTRSLDVGQQRPGADHRTITRGRSELLLPPAIGLGLHLTSRNPSWYSLVVMTSALYQGHADRVHVPAQTDQRAGRKGGVQWSTPVQARL